MTKDEFRAYWREGFGLTQGDIAKRFGVSRNTVQNWEYGPSPLPGTSRTPAKCGGTGYAKRSPRLGP